MVGMGARGEQAGAAERARVLAVLAEAGFEVYRAEDLVVQLAERVRAHLMESGVSVELGDGPCHTVTAIVRCERSAFPHADGATLHQRVMEGFGPTAKDAGFTAQSQRTRRITNPVDETHVLDVWYEVAFSRVAQDDHELVELVRWALSVPRCVLP